MQISTGTANERKAQKFSALRLAEADRGEYVKPRKVPLSEFGERYPAFAKVNKRSWVRDKQILVHLNEFFGSALLRDIGPLQVEQYKQARIKRVSPATVNREVALLK